MAPIITTISAKRPITLPVEAFEHFVLAADRPDFPMCFFMRATIKGDLEFKPFQAAVRRVLTRHPFLTMRLEGKVDGKTSRLRWTSVEPFQMPFMSWASEGEEALYPAETPGIDLHTEVGLRFFVRRSATGATVLMQVHQALCDGNAASRLVEEILAVYGLPEDEKAVHTQVALRPLDEALLAWRGRFHQTKIQLRHRLLADILQSLGFLFSKPKPLSTKIKRAGASRLSASTYPATIAVEFDADETAQIKAGAKKRGATVNDLLLTELFLALDHWQIKVDPAVGRVPLRIAVPVNMRKGPDVKMPACNVASLAFLDRYPQALQDHEALIKGVSREMRDIKDNYMGLAFIRAIGLCGRFSGGLYRLLKVAPGKTQATAVLCNLGQPLRGSQLPRGNDDKVYHGDLRLERLEIMPPLRQGTHLAIGAVNYAGRLVLTAHYDGRHLDRENVQEIIDDVSIRLRSVMIDPSLSQNDFRQRLLAGGRAESTPFWSLPIGKNVKPEADYQS